MDLGPCVIRCGPIRDIRTRLEVTRGLLECLFNCSYNEGNISCSKDNACHRTPDNVTDTRKLSKKK